MRTKQLLTFLSALLISIAAQAQDYDIEDDGIYYDIELDGIYYIYLGDGEMAVTRGPNEYSGTVIIPSQFEYEYTEWTELDDEGYSWSHTNTITVTVTSIGNSAFYGCRHTSVTIPNSVTSICEWAFEGCSETSVTIPSSVTRIDNAFGSCSESSIHWTPNADTEIDLDYAGLTSTNHCTLYLYKNAYNAAMVDQLVSSLDGQFMEINVIDVIAFADPAVEALCIANWDTDHDGVLTMAEATAVTSLGEVFKGNREITSFDELQCFKGLTSIGNGTFDYCSNLTSVTIPESVTSIGDRAFFNCHLTTLTIPSNITSIGTSAFLDCGMALNSITVERGNTKYDSRDNCNAIIETATNELLWGCNNTVIPNTVTSIGNSAFSHCMELSSINIPDGVTTIGSWAFYCCDNLRSLVIPDNVTTIGEDAFWHCSKLTTVLLGSSVKDIGNTAFQSCSRLVSVTIPESVTSIGDYAFEKCPSLTSIVVENGNPVYDSRGNCNAIIKTATNTLVSGCKNTVIPNSVTSIGDHAFMNCSGLTSVTIPNSVTSIGEYAFDQCGLTSVTIPNSVTSIDKYSFSRCHNLTEIHWTPNANTNLSSRLSNADLTSTIRTLYLYKNSDNAAMVDQLVSDLEGQFKEIIVVCPLELAAYLAEDGSGDYYCTYYNEDDSYAVGDNLAEAYTATVSGSTVTLTPIEGGVILAGTPVILRSTQETIPLNYAGSNTTATYGQNDLLGTAESLAVSKSGNIYVMRNGKFYIAVGGTIPANRAYLQLNASAGAPSRLDMVIGEATALQRVQDETEAEVWYTLSGVRVEHPTKAGIYIKNGMKVLVK